MRAGGGEGYERSVRDGQLFYQVLFVFWIEVIGVGANELDHFAVAVGSLPMIAASLIHAGEPLVPVGHLRVAFQQLTRGLLGFIQLAGFQQVHDRIGSGIERLRLPQGLGGSLPVGLSKGLSPGAFLLQPLLLFGFLFGSFRACCRHTLGFVLLEVALFVFLPASAGAGLVTADGLGRHTAA